MTTREHMVHRQLDRAAVQIFATNDRINPDPDRTSDPSAWRAKPPGKTRAIAAIFTHMHSVRTKWVRLTAPHLKVPPQHARHTAAGSCGTGRERHTLRGDARRSARRNWGSVEKSHRDGWAKPWPVVPAWFRTKPMVVGRCVCSHISSDSRCPMRWRMASGIGKSCGRNAGRLAAPAAVLARESPKGSGRINHR
jgi:hypothetical protein